MSEQRMGKVNRKHSSSPLKVSILHQPGSSEDPYDLYSRKCDGTMAAQDSLISSNNLQNYGKDMETLPLKLYC